MFVRLLNWWNGWRQDHDGWWVRARRADDPSQMQSRFWELKTDYRPCFVEEACAVVSDPRDARLLDRLSPRKGPVAWEEENEE